MHSTVPPWLGGVSPSSRVRSGQVSKPRVQPGSHLTVQGEGVEVVCRRVQGSPAHTRRRYPCPLGAP